MIEVLMLGGLVWFFLPVLLLKMGYWWKESKIHHSSVRFEMWVDWRMFVRGWREW